MADDELWRIARTTLTRTDLEALADLNYEAKSRTLTADEEAHREVLLDTYDRTMVRRAQAASILHSRGYDLSDPAVLAQ